jgi:hypothetical protein
MIILSTLIGFLSSALPELFNFFKDRSDKKQEAALLTLQMQHDKDMAQFGHKAKLAEIELQADIAESKYLGKRVTESKVGNPVIDALSGSVRPVITYLFFMLYASVKVAQFHMAIDSTLPWQVSVSYAQAIVSIWTPDDMALFASIVTFWFGNRTFNKMRGLR